MAYLSREKCSIFSRIRSMTSISLGYFIFHLRPTPPFRSTFPFSFNQVFGLASTGTPLGFSQGGGGDGEGGGSEQSREAVLGPVLDVLSEFRDRARACGRTGDAKGVMAACDHVRDELLPTVGVRLEDKGDKVRYFYLGKCRIRLPFVAAQRSRR